MRQCSHKRTGIVTNQPDSLGSAAYPERGRAHAARNCCDRPECIKAAKSWAAGVTNETAYYVPDADRSLRL